MFERLRRWRRERTLERAALPEALWEEAVARLPFLRVYQAVERNKLRELVTLFLSEKGIVGARDFEVTPLMRVIIAIQACVLILELDLGWYEGWENVVVYPDEFVPGYEYEDEAGVVHVRDEALAGEAWEGGPVLLSWADVEASADWDTTGMNLVIHEFAHKLDMANGAVDGMPPLPAAMSSAHWAEALSAAFKDFCLRVDDGEHTAIDPYAAENPAEFFAVVSEVFFAAPRLLQAEYPAVYEQLAAFYRQDLAARSSIL
ncbi:MtfA peptidase [Burkholderiales bacterium]|nr:MAG: zinc-dependent peptidase [Burkholderiales bacterium]CAG0973939.1 MtfA peptidase [Burkholderiales bacterium]